MIMKYLLYLEPYTFLFNNGMDYLIYNTLNSSSYRVDKSQELKSILDTLDDPNNGYSMILSEHDLLEPEIRKLIEFVRNSFSGDCILFEEGSHKPFIFKPMLFLNSDILKKNNKDKDYDGEMVSRNLDEITLFLPTQCNLDCSHCGKYHKQFLHCYRQNGETLSREEYEKLFDDIYFSGVSKINLVGDQSALEYANDLLGLELNIHIHIPYKKCDDVFMRNALELGINLIINIHSEDMDTMISEFISKYRDPKIEYQFIISDKEDLRKINALLNMSSINSSILPFYTGENISFFEECVYTNLEDIFSEPIDRKTIFRRQVLNENFFGKLYIDAKGDAYSNMNEQPIGNIKDKKLKELVYMEIKSESPIWLKTRDQTTCSQCLYRYLCPSLSNYELAIGKPNLCHVCDLEVKSMGSAHY